MVPPVSAASRFIDGPMTGSHDAATAAAVCARFIPRMAGTMLGPLSPDQASASGAERCSPTTGPCTESRTLIRTGSDCQRTAMCSVTVRKGRHLLSINSTGSAKSLGAGIVSTPEPVNDNTKASPPSNTKLSTVERVRQRLQRQGPILGSRITDVSTGVDDSTVEAELRGSSGSRPLVLVLDGRGRVLGWELDQNDTPIKQIATNFITSLSEGRVVDARSLLIRDLQDEITPQDLLNRWKDLEKFTRSFQRLRGTVVASEGGPQQLVLVTTQFQRVTDNLFVIFDAQGHIIGVDFPEDPAMPGSPLP